MANLDNVPTVSSRAASRARTSADTATTVATNPAPALSRTPKARAEDAVTTQTVAAATAPVIVAPRPLLILAATNPKRNPSKAHGFFELYTGCTTVEQALAAGVRGKDLSWDQSRGHILIGDDAVEYKKLRSKTDKIAFIQGKGFSLKMAGFEEPAAPPPATTEAAPPANGEQVDTPAGEQTQVEGEQKQLETAE